MAPFAAPVPGATLVGERREGAGVPLVLVHGFGGSRHDWEPVLQALPPDIPIITYDQRGFGESQAEPGAAFSHAEDLLALLDHLGLERADLCGLSLGGATALGCALRAPERVRRLVLISPMLAGWSWTPEWIALWKAIGRAARAGDIDEARALWWRHPLFDSTRDCPHNALLRQSIDAFAGTQWVRDDQRDEMPMVEQLHVLAPPTLLLTGGLDLPDFRLMADLIEGAAMQVTRIDYPDRGHLLTFEAPETVAAAMTSFLSDPA